MTNADTERRRRGRPAIGPAVKIPLTPSVRIAADKQAARTGMRRTQWLRQVIEDAVKNAEEDDSRLLEPGIDRKARQ